MNIDFGNIIDQAILEGKNSLFYIGESTNLSYLAFERTISSINNDNKENYTISQPAGLRADNTPIVTELVYSKKDLLEHYSILTYNNLPLNGIYQLVTVTEVMLNDILSKILIQFPRKISNKRKVDIEIILSASTIEEINDYIVNSLINEISYKSPKEFCEEFFHYSGVNLLEFPPFHTYMELKATRDIHIHNQGVANNIYIIKSGIKARVNNGEFLPVTIQYFMQSYEACLQLVEYLEVEFNKIWPSSNYMARNA